MRRDLPPNPVSGIHIGSVDATTDFISARVRGLYAWWQQRAMRRDGLPLWQDFDITDHGPLAPYLFVIETPADGHSGSACWANS